MAFGNRKKKEAFPEGEPEELREDPDVDLTETEEDEEYAAYDEASETEAADSSRKRGGRKSAGKKPSRKTPLIVAAVCFILLIALFTFIALRSHNRNKPDAAGQETPHPIQEQTQQDVHPGSPEDVQAADQPNPQGPADQQAASGPAGTAVPEAKTPQASAPASAPAPASTPEPTPASTAAQQSWAIDKDLVVYECILDWDNPTKYHITFAEFDAAGNMGQTYAFKDIISPSQMGAEFKDDESLPYWFFPGATVHVKANSDLSSCTVTKAA